MATKLDWEYRNDGTYHADYKGYCILAELDQDASDPIKDACGMWPMLVRSPDSSGIVGTWECPGDVPGFAISRPLDGGRDPGQGGRFTDASLIHNQVHIAELFGRKVKDLIVEYSEDEGIQPTNYCRDADFLREIFRKEADCLDRQETMKYLAGMHRIAGGYVLQTQVSGYTQGAWRELLIVATPEARKAFRDDEHVRQQVLAELTRGEVGEHVEGKPIVQQKIEAIYQADMQAQADTWAAWAFGDVYGYRIVCHDTDEERDSCWGYYGSDFDKSGLEDAAMSWIDGETTEIAEEAA